MSRRMRLVALERDEFRFAPPLNPAAVVPAQAGTHNYQDFGYRWLCHIAFAVAYGSPPARGRRRRVIARHLRKRECRQLLRAMFPRRAGQIRHSHAIIWSQTQRLLKAEAAALCVHSPWTQAASM